MFRRSVILVVAVSLAALMPVPLSACPLGTKLPGNCVCSAPPSGCDEMRMGKPTAQLAAQATPSCCQVTSAPLPGTRSSLSVPAVAAADAPSGGLLQAARVSPAGLPASQFPQVLSPPDLHALFCVFLI